MTEWWSDGLVKWLAREGGLNFWFLSFDFRLGIPDSPAWARRAWATNTRDDWRQGLVGRYANRLCPPPFAPPRS